MSECSAIAQKIGIKVDEDNTECKKGRALADNMIQLLNKIPATEAKTQMLPLQGPELWHKWAKRDKESYQKPSKEMLQLLILIKLLNWKKTKFVKSNGTIWDA